MTWETGAPLRQVGGRGNSGQEVDPSDPEPGKSILQGSERRMTRGEPFAVRHPWIRSSLLGADDPAAVLDDPHAQGPGLLPDFLGNLPARRDGHRRDP